MTLVRADGTPLSKEPGAEVLEPQEEADPRVKVLVPVYEETPYEGANYPTQARQLAFPAGRVIRRSQWEAKFVAPTIARVWPAEGPVDGGTAITITGRGFSDDATVTVGGTDAAGVTVVSATTITATTPAGAAGPADVVVSMPGPVSDTAAGAFTYTADSGGGDDGGGENGGGEGGV